jgi:rod shape determining protein RodA
MRHACPLAGGAAIIFDTHKIFPRLGFMQKRSLRQLIQWKALWQPWEHSDPLLLGLTVALTFVGGLLIRSTQIQGGWSDFWWQHLLMGAIGVVFSLVLCRFNYQWILRFHWLIYAVINLLLIAVMLVGTEALGAQRWISVFGFHLQPSESLPNWG